MASPGNMEIDISINPHDLERLTTALERVATAVERLVPDASDVLPVSLYTIEVWESDINPGGYNDVIEVESDNEAEAIAAAVSLFNQTYPKNTGNIEWQIKSQKVVG